MPDYKIASGLAYKKIDLHVHTTASKCFLGEATPSEIVEAAIAAGLHAIAVTDHNSANQLILSKLLHLGNHLLYFLVSK